MVAFHANPLPMSITSLRDHRHLEVNDAAVRHSGYSREEMLGQTKPQLGFWVTTEQRDRVLRLLHAEGRVRDLEVTFRRRSGEERQLLVNSEVISFEGEPAVLSVSLDITERKLYEDSLAALANQAKDEFLAMLGHELRNPLGADPTRWRCSSGYRGTRRRATWSRSSGARPAPRAVSWTICWTWRGSRRGKIELAAPVDWR